MNKKAKPKKPDWDWINNHSPSLSIADLAAISIGYEIETLPHLGDVESWANRNTAAPKEHGERAWSIYQAVRIGQLTFTGMSIAGEGRADRYEKFSDAQFWEVSTLEFRKFCDLQDWPVPAEFLPAGYSPTKNSEATDNAPPASKEAAPAASNQHPASAAANEQTKNASKNKPSLQTRDIAEVFDSVDSKLMKKLGDVKNHKYLAPALVTRGKAPTPSTWCPLEIAKALSNKGASPAALNSIFLKSHKLNPWLLSWQASQQERNAFGL